MRRSLWLAMSTGVCVVVGILAICFGESGKTNAPPKMQFSAAPAADITVLAGDNNACAVDLYGRLARQPGNLFFSPYSISSALAMTYAGARGQTAAQMARSLHFSLPDEQLHAAFGTLLADWTAGGAGAKRPYTLDINNAVWGQKGMQYTPGFTQLLEKYYGVELRDGNFISAADQARGDINNWADQKTHGQIPDAMPPGVLNDRTRLVLVNSIYFKGDWAEQFKKDQTHDQPFYLDGQNQMQAPLMYHEFLQSPERGRVESAGDCRGMENDQLQMVELSYVGDKLSMIVLLPRKTDGLSELESKLTDQNLAAWIGQLHNCWAQVYLPKFKMETNYDLVEPLQLMGMTYAFDGRSADFSGMAAIKTLHITDVIHKAKVDVDEEGTEAAAVTEVTMGITILARPITPQQPMVFRADHPFVFLIRDRDSGAILFMGRVARPVG
jgi:serpin B